MANTPSQERLSGRCSPLRIAIDYTPAVLEQAGIGRYTRELVAAVVRANSEHQFTLIGPRGAAPPGLPGRWVTCPLPNRAMTVLWHRLRIPAPVEWLTGPVELVHAPSYLAPPTRHARQIVTIHDLSFLRYPEYHEPSLARFLQTNVPAAARRAALVVTISEFSRAEALDQLGLPPERVVVVPNGVGPGFNAVKDPEALAAVRSRYGLPERYALSVGSLQPRKNYEGLLRAFAGVTTDAHLVIVGGKAWLYDSIFRLVDQLGLEQRVHFIGSLGDEDLQSLMSDCAAFVFPSWYEGFGLPPLEAMACGAPVIASNVSSMPEVLDDAALLVPPYDTDALAAAIDRVLQDEALAASLRARGRERAAKFTWEDSAQKLLEAYQRAAAG